MLTTDISRKKHTSINGKYTLDTPKVINAFFSISIILGVILHFNDIIATNISRMAIIGSLFFGYAGVFLFIIKSSKKLYENRIFYIWLILCAYMMSIGIVFSGGLWRSSVSINWLLIQDLRYVMYTAIGFVFANKSLINKYHQVMKFLGVAAIIFGVLALLNYDFSESAYNINIRQGIWTISYYYWWLSAAIFAYLFSYSRITGKDKFIGYGTFITYVVLGILFLKRSVVINGVFLIIITDYLKPNRNKSNNKYLKLALKMGKIIMVIILVSVFWGDRIHLLLNDTYLGNVVEAIFSRFEIDSFRTYDRSREADLYFVYVSWFYWIFGQGIGNYVSVGGYFLNALHTGFYNIIYKGGVFYFLFWIYLIKNFVKALFVKNRLSEYTLVCLCVALSATLSLLYEFSFTYTILPIGYSTSIAYLVQNMKKRGN